MFDTEAFIQSCEEAVRESEPRLAIKEVLAEAVSDRTSVARVLPPDRAGITRLHVSPALTILRVVWAPGMDITPHDHRMWAAIGIYTGGEDNAFYRRAGDSLALAGGKSLRPGDVLLLGDDAVHAVTNPTSEFAGAIHIYGGDFFTTPRSEWRGDPPREQPYDVEAILREFEQANEAHAQA